MTRDTVVYSTRREFLQKTLSTLSVASTMPGFLCRTAAAMSAVDRTDGRILVVVQLAGGNDGLNTIIPFACDDYYRARPTLGIPSKECLKVDDQVGLHPALQGLKTLLDDGHLAVIQGVGDPNPNRSHLRSMDIWETADPSGRHHDGWIGRYFDARCSGCDAPESQEGIALAEEAPLAMTGARFSPLSFRDPTDLKWRPLKGGRAAQAMLEALNNDPPELGDRRPPRKNANAALDFLRRAALDARLGAEQVQSAARAVDRQLPGRRGGLQRQLALVSRMIASDFPTRVYYVSLGGFDTHSGQLGRHQRLMAELGDSLKWFIARLKADKLLDRVVVMTFSEFGRRVSENASGGTDHGTAAPLFVAGAQVRPGVHMPHPSLAQLDHGDLIFRCDFRRVYAAVLRDWLRADYQEILRGKFSPFNLFKK